MLLHYSTHKVFESHVKFFAGRPPAFFYRYYSLSTKSVTHSLSLNSLYFNSIICIWTENYHSTENCSHEVVNSHDQPFSNYEPSMVVSHLELTRKRASVSPINPWSDTREMLLPTVLQLLHHPSVYSCCLATNETRRGDARQCATCHGMEKTLLRLLLCNHGNVFQGYSSCVV
jgi:hypothetical protein